MWPSQRLASINLDSRQRKSRARSRDRRGIRPIVTLLEERTLLSTLNLTVNTLTDDPNGPISGSTTLRDAITQANASTDSQEVINFASGLQGTIDLTKALPALANNISINGPGASSLTVQRDSSSTITQFSVFTVNGGDTDTISGMTISGGNSAFNGGGIYSSGTGMLTVSKCIITGNSAQFNGGGIYGGQLTVLDSTFTGNSAIWGGGGIYSNALTVSGSVFNNNSGIGGLDMSGGGGDGGAIWGSGTLTVTDSSFTGNSSPHWGSAINWQTGTLTVTGSIFNNNIDSTAIQ